MNQGMRNGILHSWKEISAYLECDIRTCQRWAKKSGLPVFKLGTEKGRVYAKREDIDDWIAAKSVRKENGNTRLSFPSENSINDPVKIRTGNRRYILPAFGVFGLAIVAFAIFGLKVCKSGQGSDIPYDFHIMGSKVIIVNETDRPLGEFDTGLENLNDETWYRDHFQTKKNFCFQQVACLPQIIIKDIRGDSRPEILIAPTTKNETHSGTLICLDSRGKELWRFDTGRPVTYGSREYPTDFYIWGFGVEDLNHDGRAEIIVISNVLHFSPTQVAIVNPEGHLEAEYWNLGQIGDYEFYDYDGDGRTEVFLAGLNNEYKKAALIVLDPSMIKGGSPQNSSDYQSPGLEPGSEEFYVLFPNSEIDLMLATKGASSNLQRLQDVFYLYTGPAEKIFTLNFKMEATFVAATDLFEAKYKQLLADGKIHAPFDKGRIEDALMRGILYWNGKEWVGQVARADGKPAF